MRGWGTPINPPALPNADRAATALDGLSFVQIEFVTFKLSNLPVEGTAAANELKQIYAALCCSARHRGEAVGDDQRGFVLRHALQLGLDGAFVGGIQRAGGLVKNQDGRVFMDAVYSIERHRLDTFRPLQSTCRTLFIK